MSDRRHRIRELYKSRPRNLVVRLNVLVLLAVTVVAWWQLDVRPRDFFTPRRLENVQRFAQDVYPFELRDKPFTLTAMGGWVELIWAEKGAAATAATLQISVAAVILAAAFALLLVWPASRNLATPHPFEPDGRPSAGFQRYAWAAVSSAVRGSFIVARALPEYVLAFLLVAVLGPGAWPAILALAVHNFGILGKLGAEVVENVEPARPQALRSQGLTRGQIAIAALIPEALTRWLLFFFYRWESCIRESTIVGMLGITSIGFWIQDARARDWYDQMLLFVLFGAMLVLAGDLTSALTRRYVRRAA